MDVQTWAVGEATITRVLEDEIPGIPPELFFPEATADDVRAVPWLVPDFAADDGTVALAVQAFLVAVGDRRVLVDPCVGNGKRLALPFWADQAYPWMERLERAGIAPGEIDTVVHTHLHADHIGWDTTKVDGSWVPTFPHARHLYVEAELAHRRANDVPGVEDAYEESIAPIFAAGLADVVATDHDLGDGMRLVATPGHTPGHTSLRIASGGEHAVISGDAIHHPVQCARPDLAEVGDAAADEARTTRQALLAEAASGGELFVGTHFPSAPVGRVVADGDSYRFVPVPGRPR